MKTLFLITIMLSLSYFLQAQKKGTISVKKEPLDIRLSGHRINENREVYYRNPKAKFLLINDKRYKLVSYKLVGLVGGKFISTGEIVDNKLPVGFYGSKEDRKQGLRYVVVEQIKVLDTVINTEGWLKLFKIIYKD